MEFDHMLNGRGSRQQHQQMIEEARRHRTTKEARRVRSHGYQVSHIRAMLLALINLVNR